MSRWTHSLFHVNQGQAMYSGSNGSGAMHPIRNGASCQAASPDAFANSGAIESMTKHLYQHRENMYNFVERVRVLTNRLMGASLENSPGKPSSTEEPGQLGSLSAVLGQLNDPLDDMHVLLNQLERL